MGKPGPSRGGSPAVRWELTRGTETSKYPEEEKATAIPLVAASERGPAQTGSLALPGLWDRDVGVRDQVEEAWNGPP